VRVPARSALLALPLESSGSPGRRLHDQASWRARSEPEFGEHAALEVRRAVDGPVRMRQVEYDLAGLRLPGVQGAGDRRRAADRLAGAAVVVVEVLAALKEERAAQAPLDRRAGHADTVKAR
jgi:hypothetical protein